MESERVINLSAKPFITAVIMLFGIMAFTYAMTFILPSGEFQRELSPEGQVLIVNGTYRFVEGGITFWRWLLSPLLVLATQDGLSIIFICLFLLVIGGAILPLDECGTMRYMLNKIAAKYRDRRYVLLAVTSLFFMTLGSVVGSFEDAIPLVPVAIALAHSMGWNALIGLGMSMLPLGCGFSTGICNVYTVGVAQRLAGLPLFSGMSFRVLSFIVIYAFLMWFLIGCARKLDAERKKAPPDSEAPMAGGEPQVPLFERDERMEKSVRRFALIIGAGLVLIMLSSVVEFLQGIITGLMALVFLMAGVVAALSSGMSPGAFLRCFLKGVVTMLPGIGMILIASSVKYTLTEAKILDTILYGAVQVTEGMPPSAVVLIIYALVFLMDLFIASASAKAFLLIPLIVPLAQINGISSQLAILAFIFGDGFSNLFYPTNPVLLICLGFAGLSFVEWTKWSIKFQLGVLAITSGLLLLAKYVGY